MSSSPTISSGLEKTLLETVFHSIDESVVAYDVVIQFFSAEDLPKMDVIGHADPYFIANIDEQISYTSTIISNTATPVWDNEKWIVRNIPLSAKLTVKVFDKDDDTINDDYIGEFEILNLITYHAPPKGHEIIGTQNRHHGHFHLCIQSIPSSKEMRDLPMYTFDGPCRYSRHDSLAIGRLTMLNTECVYSTWKIHIRRLSAFFRPHQRQYWNPKYPAAQVIFGQYPSAIASQNTIRLAHKLLYRRTLKHNESGVLTDTDELWKCVFTDRTTQRVRPAIYTYVIDDHTWRFSETDGQFFADFASKHALLANGSEYVRYAGEFHLRPKHGWDRRDDEWELVLDNGSGTYSPNADLLLNLKNLLLFNFPQLNIVTYDFDDPELRESIERLREEIAKDQHRTEVVHQLVFTVANLSQSE